MKQFMGGRLVLPLGVLAVVLALSASQVQAQPNPSQKPTFGSVSLKEGFVPDPYKKDLVAGGAYKMPFAKYVATAPDFELNWKATAGQNPLSFFVQSSKDTTLLIRTPNGSWIINDDGGGNLNPLVKIYRPASGRYLIWVGTFQEGNSKATLHITELK